VFWLRLGKCFGFLGGSVFTSWLGAVFGAREFPLFGFRYLIGINPKIVLPFAGYVSFAPQSPQIAFGGFNVFT
jgi:hypothetical protein